MLNKNYKYRSKNKDDPQSVFYARLKGFYDKSERNLFRSGGSLTQEKEFGQLLSPKGDSLSREAQRKS